MRVQSLSKSTSLSKFSAGADPALVQPSWHETAAAMVEDAAHEVVAVLARVRTMLRSGRCNVAVVVLWITLLHCGLQFLCSLLSS